MKKRRAGNGRRREEPIGLGPIFAIPEAGKLAVFQSAYPKLYPLSFTLKKGNFGSEKRIVALDGFLKKNVQCAFLKIFHCSKATIFQNTRLQWVKKSFSQN